MSSAFLNIFIISDEFVFARKLSAGRVYPNLVAFEHPLRRTQGTGVRHDTADAHRPNGNRHSLAYPIQISIRITIDTIFSIILSVKFKLAGYFARQRQPLRSGFEYRKNPTTPAPSRHPRHNGRSHPAGERIGPLIVSETQTSQLWDRLCPKFLSLQVRRPVRGKRSS
jgi:hypothetical protein